MSTFIYCPNWILALHSLGHGCSGNCKSIPGLYVDNLIKNIGDNYIGQPKPQPKHLLRLRKPLLIWMLLLVSNHKSSENIGEDYIDQPYPQT